ncbi:MAG TPA: hypothetical protein VFI24_09100 [Pyrinomonadaceae bacterium]|nr:hypothetical protein [Pyrinomonadaceae bacterium]
MKAIIVRLTVIMALALGLVASAQAQTGQKFKTFSVPFSFNVGSKVLPAGEYKVTADNQTIRVQKTDGKANALVLSQRTRGVSHVENKPRLTFRRYGNEYYLSQVWLPDNLGRELPRRRPANSDLAKDMTVVEIIANVIN